eukprot:2886833-Alexandrium_andersonii.AAC.1
MPPPSTRRGRRGLAGLPCSAPAPLGGLCSLRFLAPALGTSAVLRDARALAQDVYQLRMNSGRLREQTEFRRLRRPALLSSGF